MTTRVLKSAAALSKPRVRLRVRLKLPHVRKKLKAASTRALDRAGSITRRDAKKQFSVRQPKSKPRWKQEQSYHGVKAVSMRWTDSKEGKVTSWRPKTFLKKMIEYGVDKRKPSVVIGPMPRVTKINKLQEYGGSDTIWFQSITKYPVSQILGYRPPAQMMDKNWKRGKKRTKARAWIGIWVSKPIKRMNTPVLYSNQGKVPPGQFMKKGAEKARPKIAPCFRNQIRGP